MDERLQEADSRMTNEEAEAVIERFREEEETMRKEMEARATMPTVKDLAEGLNVPSERVERLLNKVRQERQAPPPEANVYTQQSAKEEVNRQNRMALFLGLGIMLVVLMGVFAALFLATPSVNFEPGSGAGDSPAIMAEDGSFEAEPAAVQPSDDSGSAAR